MRLALGVTVLATATACGGKTADPYAKSLAMGSEHVELHASFGRAGRQAHVTATGDFTNTPDRGRLHIVASGNSFDEVFVGNRIYVNTFGEWVSGKVHGNNPQTPAEMFRARLPARTENGLVRSITVRSAGGSATYVFSKYGERVSVTVPRVKGSK